MRLFDELLPDLEYSSLPDFDEVSSLVGASSSSEGVDEGADVGDKVRGVIVGDVGDSAGQNSGHGPPISSCIHVNQIVEYM